MSDSVLTAMTSKRIRVWDSFVRVFHWSLALSIAAAWITSGEWARAHEAAGYVAGALVAARLAWGFSGSRYARFKQFVRPAPTVVAYLKAIAAGTERRYLGHNPAGGAMIVALLAAIAATATTGWLLTTDAFWGSGPMGFAHSVFGNGVLVLVGAHLAGVALASWRHRENLVRAMLTGFKRAPGPADAA
jgi:cytochrome b